MCVSRGTVRLMAGALGLITVMSVSSVAAQSLKESVQTALDSYPTIQEARHLKQAIENDLGVAKSRYLPTLDFELAYGREFSNNNTTRSAGNGDVYLDRKESGIMLRETIFDGFDREGTVEQQEALLRGAEQHIGDRGETIAAEVAFAYLDVVRHTEILRLAEENITVHQKIMDDVKKRVDGGQLGIGDFQQARSRLSNAQARVAEVRLDLDYASISFNRIVGQMPASVFRPKFNDTQLPRSVDAAVKLAMETNPLIMRYQAKLDEAKALITVAKAGNYPNVFFELGGTYNDNIDGTRGIDQDFSAMLRMKWNLYRGGADMSKEKAAAARYSESMSRLAQAKRDIEQEVRRAWGSVERKDEEAKVRAAQVKANKEVTETYREAFSVGQRDLLDVLDSENELFSAKTKYITAQNSALYARFLLTATTGKLRELLGVTTPLAATEHN